MIITFITDYSKNDFLKQDFLSPLSMLFVAICAYLRFIAKIVDFGFPPINVSSNLTGVANKVTLNISIILINFFYIYLLFF